MLQQISFFAIIFFSCFWQAFENILIYALIYLEESVVLFSVKL